MSSIGRCAALAVALVTCLPATARAQPPTHDPAYDAARKRFEEGKRLIREGKREGDRSKLEMGYLEFKAAYALYPRAKAALLNFVEAEVVTDRLVDAMKHLREFVHVHGTPDAASEYAKPFQLYWEKAFRATAHIDIQAPPVMRIFVDDDEAGVSPLPAPVDLGAGHHRVDAIGADSKFHADVDATAGEITNVNLVPPAPVPVPPATSAVVAPATPSARPTLAPESTPLVPISSDSRAEGGSSSGLRIGMTIGLGAVSLASLAVAIGLRVKASNEAEQAATALAGVPNTPDACVGSSSSACMRAHDAIQSENTDKTAANWLFVGSGVFAGAAVASWFLFAPRAPLSASSEWVPVASPTSAGLLWRSSF